jgi:SAM-dependent methyltransferase
MVQMTGDDFNEHFSKYYDYIYAKKDFKTGLKDFFSFTRLSGKENIKILDVGCGTGQHSLVCINEGFDVISIDPSIHMLGEFKTKISNLESSTKQVQLLPKLICAEGQHLPTKKQFDAIICLWSVIGYMDQINLELFFLNSFQSLKKSSFLYINFWNESHIEKHGVRSTYYEFNGPNDKKYSRESKSILHKNYVQIDFTFKGVDFDINPENISSSSHAMRFFSLDLIVNLLIKAGFKDVFMYENGAIHKIVKNKELQIDYNQLNLEDIYEINLFIQS